ncbi:MAG: type II toxin-antitoxin system HipA family toxin [Opitutales bacterium]|nr:type II toxin-antitoxin system HipA family toxin [Opitutales bacterium]
MKRLKVILMGEQVGVLIQSREGKLSFHYDPQWLAKEGSLPLSQSLPLRAEKFNQKECAPFFGGLLPEENNREIIARNLGITPRNDFAMLREIGGECAGAASIIDPDQTPPTPTKEYEPISDADLIAILDQLPQRPLLAGKAEIRLSLAGAQNKVALLSDATGFAIPLHESPSTHILKPEHNRFPGLADNEAYCLKLASALGLKVCDAEVTQQGPHRCLLVTRYDRILREGSVQRLHQEDFCQALAIPSLTKYQSEGGPDLAQCFELVRRASSSPAKDLLQLFYCVLLNFLMGNHDAHGKNFSLLYSPINDRSAIRLAPFYDLISTAIYPELSGKMAMKIGKSYKPEAMRLRDWELYWKAIGFSSNQARRQSLQFIDALTERSGPPANEIESRIQTIITQRSKYLRRLFV